MSVNNGYGQPNATPVDKSFQQHNGGNSNNYGSFKGCKVNSGMTPELFKEAVKSNKDISD